MGKAFTDSDVDGRSSLPRIAAGEEDLVIDEPDWMKRGLQETASGYGARLNSGKKISFNGRLYRLYVTIYSNNCSVWFKAKGVKIFVG
jgi:hypothetical protein